MPSPVFVLSGPPGTGKSSVARALLQKFAFGLHIPLDDLREWVVAGRDGPVLVWTDETTRQFALARQSAAKMAQVYANAGFAVVVDDVIFPAEVRAFFQEAITGHPVYPVLLLPSLEVALQRHATRTNKVDSAMLVYTIKSLHKTMSGADFLQDGWQVVDSSKMEVEETVSAILENSGSL